MADFRTVKAWQKAVELVDAIYDATRNFPTEERYCLAIQMRKAAIAIPSDIAEGKGRSTVPDQRHLYREARGSTAELESDLEIARRRRFIDEERAQQLIAQTQEVGRVISGLINSLG